MLYRTQVYITTHCCSNSLYLRLQSRTTFSVLLCAIEKPKRMNLSVREMEKSDIELIVDYFINADSEFLKAMGADKNKLPNRTEWIKKLIKEFEKPNELKEFYYIIWLIDEHPIGHSNINNIEFKKSATMHLHLWRSDKRKKSMGYEFVKLTIPYYFKNFGLDILICEPYSENIAPNKVLKRIGFELMYTYETIPGWINFHQTVNRYELTKKQFEKINNGQTTTCKNNKGFST